MATWLRRRGIGSQDEQIIHRVTQILFAAEIAFCRLDGCVTKQELNLLQFAAGGVAQLGASPPQVVRCDVLQPGFLAAGLDHIPYDIL